MTDAVLGLGGISALAVLCAVLFAEECGVPLPFLPGDALLIAGGILVADGRLNIVALVAATTVAMVAGALIGHAWASRLGPAAVMQVAARLRVERHAERLAARLRSAGAVGVCVCRLLPGMRVYTNLAAGAASVPRRVFAVGMTVSVLMWTVGFSILGVVAGSQVGRVSGAVGRSVPAGLAVLAVAVAIAVTVLWLPGSGGPHRPGRPWRRLLPAALLDTAIALLCVLAVLAAVRGLVRLQHRLGLETSVLVAGAAILAYVLVARRAAGRTAGEGLMRVSYLARR